MKEPWGKTSWMISDEVSGLAWNSFVCREHHFCFILGEGCLIRLLQEDGIVDNSLSFDNDCDRQLLVLFLEVNLIPNWLVMVVCSCFVENCVSVSFWEWREV